MKKVGVTGGIGSGKTTVCTLFEMLGVPVYYADDRAKELMTQDVELVRSVRQQFGDRAYTNEGALDRGYLAQAVFADAGKLKKLNALVHPAVQHDFEHWTKQQNAPYVIKEAALIYEAGSDKMLDTVIVVTADEEERIRRIMARDGVSREEVASRMKNQLPQVEKVRRADLVIDNNGKQLIIPQVLNLHERLRTG